MVYTLKNNPSSNPLVSLITVNYNGRNYLEGLFKSLIKVTYSPIEIILVDNASTDDSIEFTRKNFPEVKIVQNPKNYMFAKGNNEGFRYAQGEIICLINNDVVVDPGFIEPVVEAFQKDSQLGACQPKILEMDHPDKFEYAGAAGGFIDRFGYPFLRGRIFKTLEKDHGQYDDDIYLFWASGACLFLRKSILKEAGNLDEDFTLHMEEIDLCWRFHLLNWKIKFISHSRIYHKGGGTLSVNHPRKMYWNFRNNIFLLVKNLSGINLLRILFVRFFLDSIAFFNELVQGKTANAWAIVQAYLWLGSHITLLRSKRKEVQSKRKVGDQQIFKYIYPGSIVWEYFIRNRKRFSDLKRTSGLLRKIAEPN